MLNRLRGQTPNFILEALQARGKIEAHAALGPFKIFREHIFSDKRDVRGPADELVLRRVRLRRDEREVGGTVGRRDGYPSAARLRVTIKNEVEAQLVQVEAQAGFQFAHKDSHRLNAQKGLLAIQANGRRTSIGARRDSHALHYKGNGQTSLW